MRPKLLVTLLLSGSFSILSAQQKGYYRTPSLYKNTVIFTAEGDLWKYDLSTGGTAARLTTHPGLEINPVISPDGRQVAFLGQYEGATDVYVMNIDGGVPKRISYDYGGNLGLSAWTKDGRI